MSFFDDESKDRVAIIGSGNWGSAIAKLVGQNCIKLDSFETTVNMYVHEEKVTYHHGGEGGEEEMNLTDVINTYHENCKYLPGVTLPSNVVAVPDLADATKDATLLIFVTPHQFLPNMLPTIRDHADPHCRGIHLIKGIGKCSLFVCLLAGVSCTAIKLMNLFSVFIFLSHTHAHTNTHARARTHIHTQ